MDQQERDKQLIKKGIWLYLLLLLFEGALRKWFLTSLATPLLVIRDPLALWIVYMVWAKGWFPRSVYLTGMLTVGALGIVTAIVFGHGSFPVAIYGARILLIHFPLMFAIGKVFDHDDVVEVGKVLLLISIPMAILIALQFYSPQSAWVNRGIGGDSEGAGFSGALGFFRPPGTFSFTNGNSYFFGLVACYVLYFWLNTKYVNRMVLIAASVAVIMALPLSISRYLLFTISISVVFALVASARNSQYTGRMVTATIVLFLGIMVLSQFSFFQTAVEAFTARFDRASNSEGGLEGTLGDRYFGGLTAPFQNLGQMPFFGYGLGMGTNVGSQLLTGKVSYLITEGEWGRLIGELGPLMGITAILIRVGLSIKLAIRSFGLIGEGQMLGWTLLSIGLTIIPQGQWSQPTSLGFSTLIGGLVISAMQIRKDEPLDTDAE